MSIIGSVMIAYTHSNATRYTGVFITLCGCVANVPAVLAYVSLYASSLYTGVNCNALQQANNIVGQSKRAYSSALT
jgi:hypothetical protein